MYNSITTFSQNNNWVEIHAAKCFPNWPESKVAAKCPVWKCWNKECGRSEIKFSRRKYNLSSLSRRNYLLGKLTISWKYNRWQCNDLSARPMRVHRKVLSRNRLIDGSSRRTQRIRGGSKISNRGRRNKKETARQNRAEWLCGPETRSCTHRRGALYIHRETVRWRGSR